MSKAKSKAQSSKLKAQSSKLKAQSQPARTRRLKAPQYKSFRLHKRIKHPEKLPGSFALLRQSMGLLRRHWRVFGGILLVYGLLNLLLVRGFGGSLDLQQLKISLQEIGDDAGQLATGFTLFGLLLGSGGESGEPDAGIYQSTLLVLVSLALVWTLRQVMAGKKTGVREAFYRGMYPLVPFILVLLVIGLQLLPLAIGGGLYSMVVTSGIAVTVAEKALWALIFFLLALLSLYMVSSSIFGLYIVTLPDMTPMKALRSARQLVLHRRWAVMRKLFILPLALLILSALIIIPLILFVTFAAEAVFFAFSIVALALAHSYIYLLYRELL
jgi:hypothetical protein